MRPVRGERRRDGVGAGGGLGARGAHEPVDRVRIVEQARRQDGRRWPRVAVGRDARVGAVWLEDADARRRGQLARHHPVPPFGHEHVGPEALPRAPLLRAPRQHLDPVDPHRDGSLNGDDELSIAASGEERLHVEDALLHLLVGFGEASRLADRQEVRRGPTHRVGRPGQGPRAGRLGGERPRRIRRSPVPERAGYADVPGAAHAPHDLVVVGVGGALGVRVDLRRAPVFELRDRAPADVSGPRQQLVEGRAVLGEETRDRSTEREELAGREPGHQRRLRLRIDSRGAEHLDEGGRRRARIAVRFVEDPAREGGPGAASGQRRRVEALARQRGLLRGAARRQLLGQRPPADELRVVRGAAAGTQIRERRGRRVDLHGGAAAERGRRRQQGEDREGRLHLTATMAR